MSTMASQITNLTIISSTVYLGADQRKIKAPRHWFFYGEFTGDRWILRTKASNAENASIWWRHHGMPSLSYEYTYTDAHIFVCLCVYICKCICVCIYIYTYIVSWDILIWLIGFIDVFFCFYVNFDWYYYCYFNHQNVLCIHKPQVLSYHKHNVLLWF